MIVGSIHLYETRQVGMIGPKQEKSNDKARFDFAGKDELEVIGMLESVLATIRDQYESQQDKPTPTKPDTAEKPLTGRQRRSHLIEDDEDDDDVDED